VWSAVEILCLLLTVEKLSEVFYLAGKWAFEAETGIVGILDPKRGMVKMRPLKGHFLDHTASFEPLRVQSGPAIWSIGSFEERGKVLMEK
jgi:hypothetical protein